MASGRSPTPEQIQEEHRRIRYLRTMVDLTANVIMQSRIGRAEAERLVEAMRRRILQLFPGKEQAYDIIYRPRFERLISEYAQEGKVQHYREH
jgi:hypothetical protein